MTNTDLIDYNALAEARETMKAKFPDMIQYYLEDATSYIAAIREGIAAQSVARIVAPAHTLKSSSFQMGALRVATIAKDIEIKAREQANAGKNDIVVFSTLFEALESAFGETKTVLPAQAA